MNDNGLMCRHRDSVSIGLHSLTRHRSSATETMAGERRARDGERHPPPRAHEPSAQVEAGRQRASGMQQEILRKPSAPAKSRTGTGSLAHKVRSTTLVPRDRGRHCRAPSSCASGGCSASGEPQRGVGVAPPPGSSSTDSVARPQGLFEGDPDSDAPPRKVAGSGPSSNPMHNGLSVSGPRICSVEIKRRPLRQRKSRAPPARRMRRSSCPAAKLERGVRGESR